MISTQECEASRREFYVIFLNVLWTQYGSWQIHF